MIKKTLSKFKNKNNKKNSSCWEVEQSFQVFRTSITVEPMATNSKTVYGRIRQVIILITETDWQMNFSHCSTALVHRLKQNTKDPLVFFSFLFLVGCRKENSHPNFSINYQHFVMDVIKQLSKTTCCLVWKLCDHPLT